MPAAGKAVTIKDIEEILEAVEARQNNFPDEPRDMTFMLVMLNIGDRYASVTCINGEWVGKKKDIPKPLDESGIPKCPDGHPLTQGAGLKLGWIVDE